MSKTTKEEKQSTVSPDIMISELSNQFPEVVNFLIYEYGFHCVGCFVSEFETLQEGAQVHGIVGEDFVEMMDRIERVIAGEEDV